MASGPIQADGLGNIGDRPRDTLRVWGEWYQDTGCRNISDSCLKCPLPQCIHDLPDREASRLKRWRLRSG
jgi:hypothetical protein